MPTVLQFRRGTTTQNNVFTGSIGEVTYNTTTGALRVHDGSTAGGAEMMLSDGSNIENNAIALGTHTTGNYVATVADAGNTNITVANSGSETSAVTLDLTSTGVSASSYGSATAIPVIAVDAKGRITSASTVAVSSDMDISSDSGTGTITVGTDTFTLAGGTNINTSVTGNTLTVNLDASPTVSGNLIISGNLTVNGTTTTVNSTNTVVSDNLIELNNGVGSNANDSGIVIERGATGNNAFMGWDESADKFVVGTTTSTGASTGDLSITATNLTVADPIASTDAATKSYVDTATSAGAITLGTDTTGNYVANGATAGSGISGSSSSESGTFTVTSNATNANTANTIVYRDGSGNFSAGTITGTATIAQYADLAENYVSDANYAVGTVLVFGGVNEVTISTTKEDKRIAGVVSSNPAYLMNSECVGEHIAPIALQGRVPCRVTGVVEKGDLIVSSSVTGVGVSWNENHDPRAGSVIGKSLVNKNTQGEENIEVVVGVR